MLIFTAGQASVLGYDSDTLKYLSIILAPTGGLYSRGKYVFEIELSEDYPFRKPEIYCRTPIYHPNIECSRYGRGFKGQVCFNLNEDWNSNMGLQDVVQALLFLLYNPQLDDALVDYVPRDYETFAKKMKLADEGIFNEDDLIYDEEEEEEDEKEEAGKKEEGTDALLTEQKEKSEDTDMEISESECMQAADGIDTCTEQMLPKEDYSLENEHQAMDTEEKVDSYNGQNNPDSNVDEKHDKEFVDVEDIMFNHKIFFKDDDLNESKACFIKDDMCITKKSIMRRIDSILNKNDQKWTELEKWNMYTKDSDLSNVFCVHPTAY